MNEADQAALTVLLAEHKEAKAEQRDRIRWRDSLVYAAVAAQILAASAVASGKSPSALLLALPLVGFLLGHGYLSNDIKIIKVRLDVRTRIAPAVRQLVAESSVAPCLFAWEEAPSSLRVRHGLMRLSASLVAFVLLPAAGPTGWLVTGHRATLPALVLLVAEAVALVSLSAEFVRYSGLRSVRYR